MEMIDINGSGFEITRRKADILIDAGALVRRDDGELTLEPGHSFTVDEVVLLMTANDDD